MKRVPKFEPFNVHEDGTGNVCGLVGCQSLAEAMLSLYSRQNNTGYSVAACRGHLSDLGDWLKTAEFPGHE